MDRQDSTSTAPQQYFIDNLDRAMAEEWIKAYHQPLIRAASGRVSDEEAFARWEDPSGMIYEAADFVPVLDRAKLTYKLDLYMANRVLQKMLGQAAHGLYVVPESINLSRSDFDCCDMVSEIIKAIDSSGLPREKLSVELSERVISSDVDFMKTVVERFQAAGIKVCMDDYGSGYSSLLILLKIRFDLLKIDKVFIDQIEKNSAGQIILTELVKTALALGLDTVAEGVENKEQVNFLREIGCTKLQGYYFLSPVSLATIIERNKKGIQIGFENPAESEYFEQLGKVNLYDLSISKGSDSSLDNYFDTMPMAIFALNDKTARFIRCNKSYREFVYKNFYESRQKTEVALDSINPGIGFYSLNTVRECAKNGKQIIIDDRMADGRILQLFIRRIAVNPVTGEAAIGIVILSVTESTAEDNLTYNYISRALAEDYIRLFFVDMDTEHFAEYYSDGPSRDIALTRKGENFFDLDKMELESTFPILIEDKKQFAKEFTKANIEESFKTNDTYSVVTRIMISGAPVYVNVKAVKVHGNGRHLIVGVSNVDSQIRAREVLERAREERMVYSRIGALMGNYIYIYTVDPTTHHYKKYNPSGIISDLGISDQGDDFFKDIIEKVPFGIYPEDIEFFLSVFTEDNVMNEIAENGFFENTHRLKIDGEPVYVQMRATIVNEDDQDNLIVGIFNIDEQIKREQSYEKRLSIAQIKANIDDLTGVKNKHAYTETESMIDALIAKGRMTNFAVAVFDLNGLKQINDTYGHQAGDRFIKKGSDIICRFFKHSPVFRVGGDEFVVIVTGYDYLNIDSIMNRFRKHNIKNRLKGDVVIAAGMSRFGGDKNVSSVFKRADVEMYSNKKDLKRTEST